VEAVPRVTVVFLVFNRLEKLRVSLERTLSHNDYPADRLDVIVVDNGSTDGSAEMVRSEFPAVTLVQRPSNVGVSGWNDGFKEAKGDYVLALDDDCYLPPDGLRRAVEAAQEHDADLVSFSVANDQEPAHRFNDDYDTGLLSFWGCSVLVRREVLQTLGGYDPEIFVWANELEFMVRFFDHGFRHLYLPEVVAVHMKIPMPLPEWLAYGYKVNSRNFGYIAGKLMRPKDALGAVLSVASMIVRDAFRDDRAAIKALPYVLRGFVKGLRRRDPVKNPDVSRTYRRDMHSFASAWSFAKGRRPQYFADRARFYPDRAATLQLGRGVRG
jgi:GT2 family glycosyltransferase